MAKTIADLGEQVKVPVTVGKSLISDGGKPIEQRIKELEELRRLENEMLEAGGYDYDGREEWREVMQHIGRS